jgi:thiol:disulfide interchange protein DsbD
MKFRIPSYLVMIRLFLIGTYSISGLGAVGSANGAEPIVKVSGGFTVPAADGSSQLVLTAEIMPGWHIYSLSQGTGGPVASRVEVDKNDNVHLSGAFQPTVLPDAKREPAFDNLMIETHQNKVTWFAPIQVSGDPSTVKIVGRVHAQACNDTTGTCSPPQDYDFTAELSKDLVPQKAPEGAKPQAPSPAPSAQGPPVNSAGQNGKPSVGEGGKVKVGRRQKAEGSVRSAGQNVAASDSPLAYRVNHAPSFDSATGGLPDVALDPNNPLGEAILPGGKDLHVIFEAGYTTPDSDGTAQLIVTAEIERGWHIYATTQGPGGPVATKIMVSDGADYKVLGPFQAKEAFVRKIVDGSVQDEHHNHVTWFAPVKFLSKASKNLAIVGSIEFEACTGTNCTPPQTVSFSAELKNDLKPILAAAAIPAMPPVAQQPNAVAAAPQPTQEHLAWQPFTSVAGLNNILGQSVDLKVVEEFVRTQARLNLSGLGAILFGFLGGMILNVMPCVLPVIGLKVMSFIEQSGHSWRKALLLNVCYSLGLLAVFFLLATLAVFANLGWGQLFAKPWFIISLTGLVFAMGLSFMDVWEIPIPGFAGRTAESDVANQEGATGAFVKGALTTVLATPCSAPLLGPALVWAAAQPPWLTYAVMLSAGLGMASPYLLIGAFPKLIGFLPKPGLWMVTFKHIMGFVLMGTVVFFLTSLDPAFIVPTVGMLFALWAACWWVGRLSPLASRNAKAVAWSQAAAFASIVAVMMFPAFDAQVQPALGFGSLTSIMRERLGYVDGVAPRLATAHMIEGPQMVAARPRAVMIDFTANWCTSCKAFERAVLSQRPVIDAVQSHNVLPLRADWTNEDPEVTKLLVSLNAGRAQIPVLAIFNPKNPNHPIVFPGPCSEADLLAAIDKIAPLEKGEVASTMP